MSVVVSFEDVGSCTRELRIQVPPPAVTAESQRVVEEFRRRARIPGFRQGKAPVEVVRRRFDKDIEQEVLERLLPRYWQQARAERQLEPLLPPELGKIRFDGEELEFTARVEVRPELQLSRLEGFELPDPPAAPTPEEIDAALEDIRRDAGTWEPVERAAGQGDLVRTRIQEIGEEEPDEGLEDREPVALEVGDPRVWEELSVAVTGLGVGAGGEFTRREGEGDEARERSFRFVIDEVAERELPALDDELAQRLGEFDSIGALRQEVERQLAAGKAAERRRQRERALLDQLRDRYPLDLPERLVNHELEQMAHGYATDLARRGIDPSRAPIDWERFAGEMRPGAERRVHARLLLDAAADQLGVDLSAGELEEELAEIARAEGVSTPEVRRRLDASGQLEELERQLRRRKVLLRLLGEGDEPAAGEGGNESAEPEERE